MSNIKTVNVPLSVIQKLQEALAGLEESFSPYKPEFLARMYRARASDLEAKGKSLAEIQQRLRKK